MSSYTENVNTDIDIAVVNGGFDVDAIWFKGPYWTIAGGKANILVAGILASPINQVLTDLIVSNFYDITFTISNETWDVGNGITVFCGGISSPSPYKENGEYTCRIECGDINQKVEFANTLITLAVGCSIDNVRIEAIGTEFFEDLEIDHRTVRGALRYSVPNGDKIYHALSWADKTNCYIRYTP